MRSTFGSRKAGGSFATQNRFRRHVAVGLLVWVWALVVVEPDQSAEAAETTQTFSDSGSIVVNEIDVNPGTPYPSVIQVSGLTAAVSRVTVTLFNVNHAYPDDLDILLVGPSGRKTYLMSDAGLDGALSNVTLSFDDNAASKPPNSDQIVSGTYQPSNYGTQPDPFAAPAPAGPYATNLVTFQNTDPNGNWSLYVMDDSPVAGGSIGGWSLSLTTANPIANLAVGSTDTPDPVLAGQPLLYTITVTNLGPGVASNPRLTSVLPINAQFLSAVASQGNCSLDQGTVICDLGDLVRTATATVAVEVTSLTAGSMTNMIQVTSSTLDLNSTNNSVTTLSTVLPAADLHASLITAPASVLHGAPFQYTVSVLNQGPSTAANARMVHTLDPNVLFISASNTVGACTLQGNLLTCALGNLPASQGAEVTVTLKAAASGTVTELIQVLTSVGDPVPGDNTLSLATAVVPVSDLAVALSGLPASAAAGSPINVTVWVTNQGPSLADQTMVSGTWGSDFTLVTAMTPDGVCNSGPDHVNCLLNPLPSGAAAKITLSLMPARTGSLHGTITVGGTAIDPNETNNALQFATTIFNQAGPFGGTLPIDIPEEGTAIPYPSSIFVSGLTSAVYKVTVTLSNLTHGFPDDLDILLVGPSGITSWLMSEAGGTVAITNVALVFDDAATNRFPKAGEILSGSYPPTSTRQTTYLLPAPAPAGPHPAALSVFEGTDPNGTWSLYVHDGRILDEGVIAGGWRLTIGTLGPLTEPAVFTEIERSPEGFTRVRFVGTAGRIYYVERSKDLRQWTELGQAGEIFSEPGLFEFVESTESGAMFYRTRSR